MGIDRTTLNEAEQLLSREIFANVSGVFEFVLYVLVFVTTVSFCVDIYRQTHLWEFGVKQTGREPTGAFLRRIAADVLLQTP